MTPYFADAGPLWAITTYYNPNRYWRRRANYTQFRRCLDLPLVAVELNLGGSYELKPRDAEVLIRCQGGDVMWQKERLLNIALAALPPSCQFVAWIDCDVLFPQPDWMTAACELLEHCPLVQPFADAVHLRPEANLNTSDWASEALFTRRSVGTLCLEGSDPHEYFTALAEKRVKARGPGHVWVARRELLDRHGLYDTRIIGGGDSVIAGAAFGTWEHAIARQRMNQPQAEHYRRWAAPFFADVQGRIGCLDTPVLHLWHGDIDDRRYRERFDDWREFDFDPESDIACEEGGAWQWATAKPGLHALLKEYFITRNEDGAPLQKAA
jgi:hypothetical protein